MQNNLKELIWKECNKANNFLQIPGIYRHFKQTRDNEDMIYAVTNISVAVTAEEFEDLSSNENTELFFNFEHTELNDKIPVLKLDNRYYHCQLEDKNKLVIYTALYADRKTYLRPLSMFLSKVDKEKYPNVKQKFRFERI